MGTAVLNALIITGVFRGRGYEEVLRLMGFKPSEQQHLRSSSPSEGEQDETEGREDDLELTRVNARSDEGVSQIIGAVDVKRPSHNGEGAIVSRTATRDNTTATTGEVDLDAVESASESGDVAARRKEKEGASFVAVLRQLHVHTLAAFVFIYVGTEVTIGGWIVTFMINERGGGASSGYVSSGFFGGLALGRVALLHVNRLLGERNAVFLYIALGIALEITVWFVPSLIGNAIAVSLVGMTLGPFYPIVMNQTGRLIPRKVLSGSIGWIAGFGQSGSAILPFLTGALANKYGIMALQPLIVAMMASMAALWFMVPSISKRSE
ncbi:hypothetical protein FRC20_005778 [Serendipita sp. 405]|nr:hypothetical protein FRC16_005524 [Serendipita sp. 398]KAG8840119.1 hypothetical protein FRC20_005778 [Serendipita sp. 405]